MPVHILPVSSCEGNSPVSVSNAQDGSSLLTGKVDRRTFLGGLLAGSLLSRRGFAMRAAGDDSSPWFAVFSDTHIAADAKSVSRGQVMARNLEAAIAGILEQPTAPSAAFIDGDLALLDGQSGDYETLVKLLKPLNDAGIPLHLTLGNHDDRDHFRSVLNCEAIGVAGLETKHVAVIPAAGHRFVLLDSLDAVNVTPGKIGADQIGWLTRILDAEPQVPVIVMVHHNLTGKGGSLTDESALVEVLKPRRQVKAVLFGHTHVWEHRAGEGDLHLVNLPAVAYPFGAEQPLGWTRLTLTPEAAALELRCVGGNREKDGQRVELSWRSS